MQVSREDYWICVLRYLADEVFNAGPSKIEYDSTGRHSFDSILIDRDDNYGLVEKSGETEGSEQFEMDPLEDDSNLNCLEVAK